MSDKSFDHDRRFPKRHDGGGELVAWLAAGVILLAVGVGAWQYHRSVVSARQADLAAAKAAAAEALAAAVEDAQIEANLARELADFELTIVEVEEAHPDVLREQIADDPAGRLLWASPTAGSPISLAYMPQGAQCFIFVRPRELADHPEGEKTLAALGPWGERAADQLQLLAGLEWRDVETLLVAATTNAAGDVEFCARLQLARGHAKEEIEGLISRGERRSHAGQGYSVDQETARFFAASARHGGDSWLVICPAHLAEELIDSAGEPPLVARDLEALIAHTDADRTATIVASTGFLAAGAARVVSGEAEPLRAALADLAGRDATAIALSADWGDRFFVELTAAPALTASPRWLATTLAERVATAAHHAATPPPGAGGAYGQAVVERFPGMLGRLAAMIRHGEQDNLAVLRAYLPVVAGHNLLMATELLLAQPGGPAAGE